MLAVDKIQKAQQKNRSFICLGLDLDPKRMPQDHAGNLKGMFDFLRKVIDATADQVCAYKPNLAFYENLGPDGLSLLQAIVQRIPNGIPVILDGKRNDIGNTASQYAAALYERYKADWVTINPYMGYDSMRPFLERNDRGAFILCLTSNAGSKDFQLLQVDGRPLYEIVADRVAYWNKDNNCGLVVGATHPEQLRDIRRIAGDMPLLIPGVGAQGGSLEKAVTYGTDDFKKIAVINVSRSVLYASNKADFADRARQEIAKLNAIVTKVRYGDQSSEGDKTEERKDESAPPNDSPQPPDQSSPPDSGSTDSRPTGEERQEPKTDPRQQHGPTGAEPPHEDHRNN